MVSNKEDGSTPVDTSILNMLFGNPTCIDSTWTIFWWYVGFALISTIFFIILAYVPINHYFEGYNPNAELIFKAVMFFIIILVLDWIFVSWRNEHPICR